MDCRRQYKPDTNKLVYLSDFDVASVPEMAALTAPCRLKTSVLSDLTTRCRGSLTKHCRCFEELTGQNVVLPYGF